VGWIWLAWATFWDHESIPSRLVWDRRFREPCVARAGLHACPVKKAPGKKKCCRVEQISAISRMLTLT